jgi:hypothetical protein
MSDRERFSLIEVASNQKQSLEERLNEFPELREKVESMLDVIQNAAGDVEKAAEAEQRVVEELRQMGNTALHSWARRQEQKKEDKFKNAKGVNRKEKKTSTGTLNLGKSRSRNIPLPKGAKGD